MRTNRPQSFLIWFSFAIATAIIVMSTAILIIATFVPQTSAPEVATIVSFAKSLVAVTGSASSTWDPTPGPKRTTIVITSNPTDAPIKELNPLAI